MGTRLRILWSCICGVVALTSATGGAAPTDPALRWTHRAEGWGEPAAAGSLAYFMTRQHEVVALDATTGALRWRVSTGGAGNAPWGSAIRVAGEVLVVGDGGIVALDRASGQRRWGLAPEGGALGPFLGAAIGMLVHVGSADGRIVAIDMPTGQVQWTGRVDDTAGTTVYAPIAVGDTVVATYRRHGLTPAGGLAAFDGRGRRLWRRALRPGVGAAGPPVAVGSVLVLAGTDGTLTCWDARTGLARGTLSSPEPGGPDVRRPPAAPIRAMAGVGNLLVAGSLTGRVVAYDVRTRREAWRFHHPDGVATLRLHADATTVYAPFTDDTLIALDASTGRERWRLGGPDRRVEWPPASDGHAVYVAGADTLMALVPAGIPPATGLDVAPTTALPH
ncbi:MAG: PQQ-binding-like beta-propeller repeat protein [Vicinamibacteraceae bacterium]